MVEKLDASKIITRCGDLKTFWSPRTTKMREWYKQIQLVDELKQKGMESFVGNDPRASFNIVLGMLEQDIPHRIRSQDLTQDLVKPASDLSIIFDSIWRDIYYQHRLRGGSWLRDFIGLLLATGWYSVFANISADGSRCFAEIWNPASVFQSWEDGLSECAHLFPVSRSEANRMAVLAGWKVSNLPPSVNVSDYWKRDENGDVFNAVCFGREAVKPFTHEPRFDRIPIFTGPAGGLPDTGIISGDIKTWKKEMGQSLVATNEKIYRSWNKWWTFLTQILRDTAQPRWIEKSASAIRLVKPEDVFKYGTVLKIGLQDSFDALRPPALPPEIRAGLMDMEAMLQRGGPSWATYGAIQQQLSSYVMSQISASLRNVAKPFHDATIDMFSDVDNFFWDLINKFRYKPYGSHIPEKIPPNVRITADYEVKIPGDLVQRATVARMLDPDFEISPERVMEEVFPEIRSPQEELARVRAAKAQRHPIMALITLVSSCRTESELLSKVGDSVGARLYSKAADTAESMMESVLRAGAGVGEAATRAPSPGPETVPPPSRTPPESI